MQSFINHSEYEKNTEARVFFFNFENMSNQEHYTKGNKTKEIGM